MWRGESDVNGISGARLRNNVSLKRVTGTAAHFYSFCYLSLASPALTLYVCLLPARRFIFFPFVCALNFLHPVSCTHRQRVYGIREKDENIPRWMLGHMCVHMDCRCCFFFSPQLLFWNAHLCASFPRKLDDDITYVLRCVLFFALAFHRLSVAWWLCACASVQPAIILLVHRLLASLYIDTYTTI